MDCLDKESNWFAWLLCKCPLGASPEYNRNILRGSSRPILKFSHSYTIWISALRGGHKNVFFFGWLCAGNGVNGQIEREREKVREWHQTDLALVLSHYALFNIISSLYPIYHLSRLINNIICNLVFFMLEKITSIEK